MNKINARISPLKKQELEQIASERNTTPSDLLREGVDHVLAKYHPPNHEINNILILGGTGYIGKALHRHLAQIGKSVTLLKADLSNPHRTYAAILQATKNTPKFDVCYNLAADVGGIGYTSQNQFSLYWKNFCIIKNVFDFVYPHCNHLVQTSSACIYPSTVDYPTSEYFIGARPDKQVQGYGLAKLLMPTIGNLLPNVSTLILTNVYGEYLNSCESFGEKSHVTAALVQRFVDAAALGQESVTLWGDGSQTRDFVHVEDVVKALVLASKPRLGIPDGFNIANGVEIPIKHLANIIARIARFSGEIIWDSDKPTGVRRRWLDTKRARAFLEWEPGVDFEAGLRGEIKFYIYGRPK